MADEISNENTDAGLDPNQVQDGGNPVPKQPPAKDPAAEKAAAEAAEAKAKVDAEAAEAAEEGKGEDEPDDDAPLDVNVWGDTGSDTGNAVLQLLQNSGATTGEAKELLFDAVAEGKPENIDQKALEDKFGKAKAHLIMVGIKGYISEAKSKSEAIVADLHNEVGGKDNWKTIAEWANKNVDAAELDTLRGMVDAGGMQAKLAARELKARYEGDDNNSTLDAKEVVTKGGNPSAPKMEPLSAREYANKLEQLHRAHNGNPPEQLRRALLTARNRGKELGV